MDIFKYIFYIIILGIAQNSAQILHESDVNFRVEPGTRTCFFEKGQAGHTMELFYNVLDGQHGDYDISFDVIDPGGKKIISDYKKSQNSVIMDLEMDGDYAFCMDNTYSMLNSKLVFVYVMIEGPGEEAEDDDDEATLSLVDEEGREKRLVEVLQWIGTLENGEQYFMSVEDIADSLSRTLKRVVKARHLLELLGATRKRDTYLAFEDTFIVDIWSAFQISFMLAVGMLQVYMIKSLFGQPRKGLAC